jgi:ribosomal 50S subunit-recycling heat shock protein
LRFNFVKDRKTAIKLVQRGKVFIKGILAKTRTGYSQVTKDQIHLID